MMSDAESVSVEVRELLELVLEVAVEPVTDAVTLSNNELDVPQDTTVQPNHDQPQNNLNSNVDLQQKVTPMVTKSAGSEVQITPAPDLRVIESNALKLIAQYGSDSSESEYETDSSDEVIAIDNNVETVLGKAITEGNYRVISSDSEESTSSDDSDCEVISIQNEIINLDDDEESDPKSRGPIRVEGEFTIDSLPPIEDLKISVPEDECVVLGKVISIVDQLVVVDSLPGSRTIDIDSILFLEKGTKPLGHVFDVLGNISSPMYCVRFNSNKQILEKGITVGALVYVAPRTEHTSFVIVSELMKHKGCDASWKNDIEPMNMQDFSDDEEERRARKQKRGRNNSIDSDSVTPPTIPPSGNGQRNSYSRTPRRRGRGGRGGSTRDGNYFNGNNFGTLPNHSWHHNYQPSNWNSPMRNNAPIGPFPSSLLLPPPPPPPPFNSRR